LETCGTSLLHEIAPFSDFEMFIISKTIRN